MERYDQLTEGFEICWRQLASGKKDMDIFLSNARAAIARLSAVEVWQHVKALYEINGENVKQGQALYEVAEREARSDLRNMVKRAWACRIWVNLSLDLQYQDYIQALKSRFEFGGWSIHDLFYAMLEGMCQGIESSPVIYFNALVMFGFGNLAHPALGGIASARAKLYPDAKLALRKIAPMANPRLTLRRRLFEAVADLPYAPLGPNAVLRGNEAVSAIREMPNQVMQQVRAEVKILENEVSESQIRNPPPGVADLFLESQTNAAPSPEQQLLANEQAREDIRNLALLRDRLSKGERRVFDLLGAGLSLQEIAVEVQRPVGSVENWLHRIRQKAEKMSA